MSTSSRAFCATSNWCELTGGGPACGRTPEHLSPVAPPGSLCPQALRGQYEFLSDIVSETPLQQSRLLIQRAGSLLELSAVSAPAITNDQAKTYVALARQLLTSELPISDLRGSSYIESRLLALFSDDFRNNTNRVDRYADIRRLMGEVRKAPEHGSSAPEHLVPDERHRPCFPSKGERKGANIKLASLALCELAELNILPATWRCRRACDAFINEIPTKFVNLASKSSFEDQRLAVISFENLVSVANQLPRGQVVIDAPIDTLAERITTYIERDKRADPRTPTNKAEELMGRMAEQLTQQLSPNH